MLLSFAASNTVIVPTVSWIGIDPPPERRGAAFQVRPSYKIVPMSRSLTQHYSHASFFLYTVSALLTLPFTIAFNYCGESVSSLFLSISEAFFLLAVVIPRTHFSFGAVEFCSIALPVMDSILIIAGLKAFRPPWHENIEQRQPLNRWWTTRSNIANLIKTHLSTAQRLTSRLTLAIAAAIVLMLPLLKLSGELADMMSNCYISGQSQFILRLWSLGALHFAVLIGFALASSAVPPIFVASMLPSIHAVMVAAIFHRSLAPMDWTHLALCWALMLVRILRDETKNLSPSTYKGHRGIWKIVRKVFLCMVVYAVVLQACFTFKEYIRTGSIAMLVEPDKPPIVPEAFIPPEKVVGLEDAYLGDRPDADARVEWAELMANCADSVGGRPVEDIVRCLQYLSAKQDEYVNTTIPSHSATSTSQVQAAKQLLFPQKAHHVVKTVKKTKCEGPSHIFHTYWTGHATWRVELFIKAYLYSQNLSCSRLWIWLDADSNPRALDHMLYHDPRFQRFHALMDEGYIELKTWKFPERIPLPRLAETDPMYQNPGDPLPDGLIRDESGNLFLVPDPLHKTVSTPTQISDLVRFVVLHLHGGLYMDMDVLLLRDLRPFLLPDRSSPIPDQQPAWAEQWVEQITNPGDYNTAVLSLPANSSLSSYLLQGGRRMGMNFHPRVLGLMIWKDGRKDELAMLHNAVFDPLLTNLRRKRTNICTVPCHKNFEAAFMTNVEEPEKEWSNFQGNSTGTKIDDLATTGEDQLSSNTNRTMANFFRGAFAYHIHNQVSHVHIPLHIAEQLMIVDSGKSSPNLRRGWMSSPKRKTAFLQERDQMPMASAGKGQGWMGTIDRSGPGSVWLGSNVSPDVLHYL